MARKKRTVTEYRNYFLPLQFPVLLLAGDYWKISDVPSGRLHFHNCLEIGVCHSDSGSLEILGNPLPFQAGDVTVIPRNIPHTTYSAPGTESHWSYLFIEPQELFRNIIPGTWKNFDLSLCAQRDFQAVYSREAYPQIYQLATSAIREMGERKPGYQLSAKGLLLSLYIEVIRILTAEGSGGGTDLREAPKVPLPSEEKSASGRDSALIIAPALDYIEENYGSPITIERLADLCHWSEPHFRNVFRSIMGTSPLDFINTTRVTQACNLLRSTEESILDISETVGFRSVSSFNRCFIRIMQMSPREFRKKMYYYDKNEGNASILEYSGWLYPEK